MIYVYAICDPPRRNVCGVRGLDDQPLAVFDAGPRLSVLCSRHSAPGFSATVENLWTHEAAVEALMSDHAVLPVRFGTTFPSDESLGITLARCAADLVDGLDRVRGRVELGVRVLWPPSGGDDRASERSLAADADDSAGRQYLLARLAEERRRRRWTQGTACTAEEIHRRLSSAACAGTRRLLVTPELLLTGAYLVPCGEINSFRDLVERTSRNYPAARVLCTGPWPVYHFVPQTPILEVPHVRSAHR